MQKLFIIGNLGKEPEVRQVGQSQVASFTVCSTEKFKDSQGQLQEESEWFNCEYWNAGGVLPYLHKGSKVFIEGKQKTDLWTDQQNQKHSIVKTRVLSLQMLDAKPQYQPQGYQQAPPPQYQRPPQYNPQVPPQYPPQYQPQGGDDLPE